MRSTEHQSHVLIVLWWISFVHILSQNEPERITTGGKGVYRPTRGREGGDRASVWTTRRWGPKWTHRTFQHSPVSSEIRLALKGGSTLGPLDSKRASHNARNLVLKGNKPKMESFCCRAAASRQVSPWAPSKTSTWTGECSLLWTRKNSPAVQTSVIH